MSKRCQFKVCSHHPLYYCIMFTRSSLSCLLTFNGIPMYIPHFFNSKNFLFTCKCITQVGNKHTYLFWYAAYVIWVKVSQTQLRSNIA